MHYLDMLAKQFNKDLLPDCQQLSFVRHSFSDEDILAEQIQILLRDLDDDMSVIRNHVLVLFETAGYQLTKVRSVMVTPNLDIAENCSQDWSEYISGNAGIVVEKVSCPNTHENRPDRGLRLKAKAIQRKNGILQVKSTDDFQEER